MKPPALTPGDVIGVMAPSSYVEAVDIVASKEVIEQRGYKVFIHPQTLSRHNQSAGTHAEKVSALHDLWTDSDIKAIWCAGGGNRALHLLDKLDFSLAKQSPKAMIGFSDVTALLNAQSARGGPVGYHGPVFKDLHKAEPAQIDQCLAFLAGETPSFPLESATVLRDGKASGTLYGGCLSIFHYLPGTADGPDMNGAILFLEDASDHISRIDRMLLHLKRQGVFDQISGLILGEFLDMQDGARPFGFSLEELIEEHTAGRDIPIIMNAPFGHGSTLYTLPVGMKATFSTAPLSLTF